MNTQNRILEAIDVVIGWDLPDDTVGVAIAAYVDVLTARPFD